MEIIKEGKVPTYIGECEICGCTFIAAHRETKMQNCFDCSDPNNPVYYERVCECPMCKTVTGVRQTEDYKTI